MSRPLYRFLLAVHVVVSGGWLGIVFAKLALGLAAVTSDRPGALYTSMEVVNVAFPPAAVATLVTGVLLSLGTKWGLLRHYWVATKLVLTVGVIVTGIVLVDGLVRRSISGQAINDGTVVGVAPATFLISLSTAHGLMLVVATVLSVYRPWGKTHFGRGKKTERRWYGESA